MELSFHVVLFPKIYVFWYRKNGSISSDSIQRRNYEASDVRSRSYDMIQTMKCIQLHFNGQNFHWRNRLTRAVNASFLPVNTSALQICLREEGARWKAQYIEIFKQNQFRNPRWLIYNKSTILSQSPLKAIYFPKHLIRLRLFCEALFTAGLLPIS